MMGYACRVWCGFWLLRLARWVTPREGPEARLVHKFVTHILVAADREEKQ